MDLPDAISVNISFSFSETARSILINLFAVDSKISSDYILKLQAATNKL